MVGAGDDLRSIEQWFVERGIPNFVERDTEGSVLDVWTRALPLLGTAYLLLGLQALDLRSWTLTENVATAVLVLVIAVGTWAVSNRLRGRAAFARPTDIDAPELALFLVGPTVPVLLFGQIEDAIETVALAVTFLLVIYVWSAYGIGPIARWALRRTAHQIGELVSLVSRALPLLLLFNAFLFINAEVWEVAGALEGLSFWIVIGTFVVLGATFAVTRVPRTVRDISTFSDWDEVASISRPGPAAWVELPSSGDPADRLRRRQRLNIGLVVLFGPAIQITLVVIAIIAFFVGFGFVAIPADIVAGWTKIEDVRVLAEVDVGSATWQLSGPLLRVSAFLGAFSGMYFTVLLTTDATYQAEFEDEAGPQIREAMAVRTAYRVALGRHPAVERSASVTDDRLPPTTATSELHEHDRP